MLSSVWHSRKDNKNKGELKTENQRKIEKKCNNLTI